MTVPRRLSSSAPLAAAVCLVALAGCAKIFPSPRQAIAPDARQALGVLQARWVTVPSVRTLAEMDLERGGERARLQGVLLARPPGSVRFEALSPFGQPMLLATVHEGQLTAYDAGANEGFVGPATPDTTGRVFHLPLDAEDLVAVLAGHAVVPSEVRAAWVIPPDEFGPSLEVVGPVNRRRIWMDLETGLVHQWELTGGRAEARVQYERAPDGTLLGFQLSAMPGHAKAAVRYQAPQRGVDLPDELFTFTLPNTAKIKEIR